MAREDISLLPGNLGIRKTRELTWERNPAKPQATTAKPVPLRQKPFGKQK